MGTGLLSNHFNRLDGQIKIRRRSESTKVIQKLEPPKRSDDTEDTKMFMRKFLGDLGDLVVKK